MAEEPILRSISALVTRVVALVRKPDVPRAESFLFEDMQDVLRIAADCPPGQPGDGIRRATCELIEAGSVSERVTRRRRLLNAIARIELRHSRGRSHQDDPSPSLLRGLTETLRRR